MDTLSITGIQSDLKWEDRNANLGMFEEKINSLQKGTEIVVLPEMFSTGFSVSPEHLAEKMDGPTVAWMKKMATNKKIILTGSVIIEENGNYFNRLIWMLPGGQMGCYDKRHRFAFAGEDQRYAAGNKRLIASVKGWRINLQVCYDLRFPVWARQDPDAMGNDSRDLEYDLLIYVANWPESRVLAWKTLLRARAIENQCYVVGVNRNGYDGSKIYHSGNSLVVDPLGELLYEAPAEENIFNCVLQKQRLEEVRSRFPFWKDADHFIIQS